MTEGYTVEDIKAQIKPLSDKAFVRFFQNLYRKWLGAWYGFADKHEKLAAWIYKIAFFIIFSLGVTILQYIGFTALPYAFGIDLAGTEWFWPHIKMATIEGKDFFWNILGYEVQYDETGKVIIGGGVGYFISYEISVFVAQCINFPLQRNITYRSHGNPWYQAMWYFIGWVLISLFCNAINGLWLPFGAAYMPLAVYNLLVMFVTGGVSLIIFFFIFMIIFPDNNAVAKRAKAKLDKLVAANASTDKIAAAEAKYQAAQKKADYSNAEKEYSTAVSQASNKAVRYFSFIEKAEKNNSAQGDEYEGKIQKLFNDAAEAIENKIKKEEAFAAVKQ